MNGKKSKLNILIEEINPTSKIKKENIINNNSTGNRSKINQIIDKYNNSNNNETTIDSGWDKIEKRVQEEYLYNLKKEDPKQYYRLIAGYGKKTTSKKKKRKQRKKKT